MINDNKDINKVIKRYMKIKDIKAYEALNKYDFINIINSIFYLPNKKNISKFFCEISKYIKLDDNTKTSISKIISRISQMKKILFDEYNYPVLSINPVIIDIDKYKKNKTIDKSLSFFVKTSTFKVLNIDKNILVLMDIGNKIKNTNVKTKIRTSTNNNKNEKAENRIIKILLKKDISNIARKGDVLCLMVSRQLFMFYWNIVKVGRIYPNGLEQFERKKV